MAHGLKLRINYGSEWIPKIYPKDLNMIDYGYDLKSLTDNVTDRGGAKPDEVQCQFRRGHRWRILHKVRKTVPCSGSNHREGTFAKVVKLLMWHRNDSQITLKLHKCF